VNFSNFFSVFLLVCILQSFVSITILLIKKYRRIYNLFLVAIFILFLIQYSFYFFEYRGFFIPDHFRASAVIPFQILLPIFIYLYAYSRIYENITGVRELLNYFWIFIFAIVLFIPVVTDSFTGESEFDFFYIYSQIYRVAFSFALIIIYFFYAKRITTLFADFNKIERGNFIHRLQKLSDKLTTVKATVFLLLLHGFWFLLELFISVFFKDFHKIIDLFIAATLFFISLVLSYSFLKNPKVNSNHQV
jgi:hypothetical protein